MGDDESSNHKKKIRSEVTYFRGIYEELGRSPCPEEIQNWGTWKYRNTDYEPWQEDKQIKVHCSNRSGKKFSMKVFYEIFQKKILF